jgi:hypothetical protein
MSGIGVRGHPGIAGPTGPSGHPVYNNLPDYIVERGRQYIRKNKILNCAYANVLASIEDDETNLFSNKCYLNGLLDMYIILTDDKFVRSRVFENLPDEIENPDNYNSEGSYYNNRPLGAGGG